MPPKLVMTAEEVSREYNLSQSKRDCSEDRLSHAIDTEGSCVCGFFIMREPSGTFPFIPNRRTRRALQKSFPRSQYVMSKEDRTRLAAQRAREDRRREERDARRADRKLAALSGRTSGGDKPLVTVSLLVGAENGQTKAG